MSLSDICMIFYLLLVLVLGMLQHFIPFRKQLRTKPSFFAALGGGVLLLFVGACLIFPILRTDLPAGAVATVLIHFLVIVPAAFVMLRDCALPTLFVASYHLCLAAFILGLGNWLVFWPRRL
ncbi:MAG: hypothetical protein LBM60_06105, partial [Clostridium sp.]|nr:hypothetical protein [Clostridium sp.]